MGKSWDDLTSAASASESDWDKLSTPEGKPKTGRTAGEFLKDVGADILGGTLGVAKVGALVGDAVSHRQGFDNPAVRFLNEFGDSVSAQKSDVLREKEQANEQAIETAGKAARETYGDGALGTAARVASEFGTGAKGILTDPALLTGFAAQQIPMLGGMGVGSAVANETVGAAAKALPKLAATKAGQVAVGGAGTAGAVGAGMALQGTEVADSAYNELMKLPDAAWRNHPAFESLAAKIGAEQAKVAIANREAAEAGGKGALATLLTTLIPGGASVERLIAGKGVGSLKAIPGAVFGEARQEGLEEGFGKLYGNQAVGAVDPTKDVWQGVGGNAGQGAVGGGMLGGAMTGGRLALDSVDEPAKRMAEALAQRGDAGSGNAPVTADEVLGHSSFANSEQPPAPAKQSEAEKALLAPKPITALDRVTEIDTELTNIAPKLTNDPAEVDKAEQLQAERDGITATWPKAALGAPASFSTETGARLDGQYALIEADELTTSHDENLKPTPTYPPEMQPRERDRTASEMQIQAIVGRLDPARLGESADAATGAPIVGADGLVESGNARTIALKRVYQANGQKAADYKQFIKDQAGRLGITQESIDAMRKPVLVRVRTTPVNRAEFARQANASTVAQMSPSEQAKADAARIDALDDLNPDESGDFATSRNFIRRFVARLPGTEQAGMIDADGELSQSGYTRVRNAVLAKAYGDSPVLMRMVESLDDDQRNVSKALMKVAPTVAKMRQSIGEGALFDADLTPDLLAAVDALGTLRGKGRTVATELAQSDVFGGKYSDETREILAFLADNIRRPNQIAALIQQFAEVLGAAGNPNQGSLLGEATAPAKRDILAAARRELNDNDAAGNNGETGQGHRDAGAEARRQPEAAPGAAASDSRNEAARGRESAGQSEWVAFPAESGTLGIPRAEMPQVKGEHRGALIQFLEARGITYERVSVPPSEIKPTQAEFSTKKAAKWAEVREDVDRSVLMSSDGHILDGHHQYVAALAAGEPVTAIRFDAPIRELLAAVFQFPSVKQSEGSNVVELRAQARQEFKDAMADLAQIMTKHTRAAMMPEDTPGLMPTLVKLFEAGIKEVGYSLKDLVAYVKARLKDDSRFKTSWNKIDRSTLNKAAQQAIENAATQRVDDLFARAEERNGQQDMFARAEERNGQQDMFAQAEERNGQADLFSQPTKGGSNVGQKTAEVLTKGGAKESTESGAPGSTNPKNVYRAYVLTKADREKLSKLFPASHERVIADHVTAEGLNSMDKVVEGPAKAEVIGISDAMGLQSLILRVNGRVETSDGTPFHITWSARKGAKSGQAGEVAAKYGYHKLDKPIPIDLSAGPTHSSPLSNEGRDARRSWETDKEFAKRVVDKRAAPETLPENHSSYFKMEGAEVVSISNLISTKSAEENSKGGENGAKRMAAAANNELARRAPITVMPSEDSPGKYEVVDGNGTLTSVSKYGWKSLPVLVVSRAEGLKQIQEDRAKDKKDAGQLTFRGKVFDWQKDNFGKLYQEPKILLSVVGKAVVDRAHAVVEKYFKNRPEPVISEADRTLAEKLLSPRINKAIEAKDGYDRAILDIADSVDAIGVMLAPVKSMGRAVIKLVTEERDDVTGELYPERIKDLLRSTIVVRSYEEAQAVIEEIAKRFETSRIKNRSEANLHGINLKVDDRHKFGGYSDVLLNVITDNGTVAEIQINVPVIMAAKSGDGHKLYEIYRDLDKTSDLAKTIWSEMSDYYGAAFLAKNSLQDFAEFMKLPSPVGAAPDLGSTERGDKSSPLSSNTNNLPSGNSTKSSPEKPAQNLQPSGNLSGTFISTTSNDSIAKPNGGGYTNGINSSIGDANAQHGNTGTEGDAGQGAGTASAADGKRPVTGIRDGAGRGDQQPDRHTDGGARQQAGGERGEDTAGEGGNSQHRGQDGDGNRSARNAAIPAGRDIPAKSGRNYQFGDGDLTYAGSWHTKARQNVEAVELLKKLETEGRQAARDEQATLARFIGWGSSEMANSIFGEKLDKQLEALSNYDEAIERLGDSAFLTNASHYNYSAAFKVLQAKNPALNWYTAGNITKAMLDAAKPDVSARKWGELRDRLKKSMTQEQWDSASRSTQYAHYTSKPVVKALLGAVSKMGFKGGTILEPGAGIGVFPGLMSSDVANNSIYTGIEFDPITGGILKQLFPDERILVESFIDSKLPENFYDVAFGNPPFGAFKVLADPKYVKHAFALHDYFFAKSLDSVKPGGLLVFVTSRYTMDKKGDKARAYMAERADLVGAIRLPQTAFQKNAGTEVVTDILFLRKKVPGQTFDQAQPWMELGEVQTDKTPALVNQYFAAHPEMVMGKHALAGSMYSKNEYTVLPNGGDIEAQIVAAVENLPADVFVAGRGSAAEAAKVREMDFDPKAKKEGSFYVTGAGILMQREGGIGVRAEEKHQKNAAILKDYISLRDAVKQSQLDQLSDGDWESSLKALQKAYAGFVQKNGRLFQHTTYMQKVKVEELDDEGAPTGQKIDDEEPRRRFPAIAALRHDPEYTLALALENFNEDTGEITDSKWLTERTLGKPVAAEVRTPADALLATLNDTGVVDMVAVADRIGLSEQETIDALGTLVYEDPAQGWVMADEYLSGNVKSKLAKAEEAAKSDKAFSRNVEALKSVQPAPRSPEQITPQIGMNWIPGAVYEQFLEDVAGVKAKIEYVKRTREWVLTTISGESSPRATSDWGVGDKAHAGWLMEKSLSGAPISLNKSVSDGKGGHKQTFDPDRTEAANQKRMELRAKFREWLFQDAKRTTDLVQLYNDKFNTTVQRKFDGTHLTLPGTSKLFKIFDHVKRGAWRVIQTGNTYLAHAVGSGKTFEMVISAMEQKRLGLIKKPMIIVPGHMLQQFASEWQQLYPTARLMVADETDFHTDNRRRFVSRVAMSDLDGVIMTHSSFGLLDLDPVFKQKMIEQELDVMRASYEEAGGDLDDIGNKKVRKDPKIKRIEAQIEKLEQQLAKAMSSEGKDKNVRFDEMGVDMLYVDEAHLFRKLSFATSRQTKGIDPAGSQMAWDLYIKTRWLAEKNPTRNLVMASGTAITNTTAELYTVQRFMAPQVLEENGLSGFDDWASQFGEESTSIESTASGKYEPVTRFQNFVNVGEMTQMFRDFADVLNEDHLAALLGDERPKVFGGGRKPVITPKTESYKDFLAEELAPRIQASRNWKPSKDELYNPDPIIAINIDARLAAIDMRFMDPSLPNDPDSKLNHLIDGVIRVYKETESNEYRGKSTKDKDGNKVLAPFEEIKGSTQMVFFESGFGKMVAQRRGFNARAWMEKRLRDAGIPPSQLAFMEDYKKSTAKLKLFKEVNSGKVRVLVGSSAAMGTGVNAQQRLIALHHLDAPYVPAILEQREGRIVRQGNKNSQVQIYAYSMFGSFDENQWSMLARKKFFIEQAMSGDPNIRSIEDVGEVNQLEMAAGLVAENPFVMQHAGAKAEVEKLTRLYRSHEEQRGRMREDYDNAGRTIAYNEQWLPKAEKAAERVKDLSGDKFVAKAGGKDFAVRKEWGAALMSRFKDLADKLTEKETKVGEISGFDVTFSGSVSGGEYRATLRLMTPEPLWMAADSLADPVGLALRSVNGLVDLSRKPGEMRKIISEATSKREALESRLDASFPLAEQLANKIKETADLEAQMMAYGSEKTGLDREQEIEDAWQERTGAITPMFSRLNQVREDTGRRIHTEDLNAVANAFRAAFPGLPVHALESERQAPKELLKWIGEQNARGEWSGAIHRGEIYLLRSGLMDAAHAMETAIHEAAHAGLERMFGQQLDGAMLAIYQTNPSVRAKADALMQRYRYSAVRATNEVLADMGPKAKRVIAWSKLVARVRDILRGIKIGGKPLVKQWSDNDINALVLRALAAAKRPAGGVAQGTWTALSRSAMKSLSANMQRGFDSLAKAITERTSVHRAMFRNGLGWVDFVWGDQGEVKASGRTKGARGLSHIVEARMRKDGLSESQAIAVLREMVRAIAAGEEFDRKAFADVVRVGVRHDGFIAWLAKRPGGNAWVVTGYEENPDGKAAGRATASPTSAAASLTRDDDGAGSIGSVGVLDADGNTSLSRVGQAEVTPTLEQQADAIISTKAATAAPLDALVRASAQALKIDKLTTAAYDKAGALLDRLVPEAVKAGIVSDYGVPEAVIDRRVVSEARQKKQTRAAGALIDKLSTLTRAESRVAYAWMNNDDPQAAEYFEQQLPEESAKVLAEVKKLIDDLSKEAMRLGQLSPEAFERNRFAYLHRSYVKHTAELTKGETKGRARAISILGDQYKGRGMVDGVPMSKVMNTAPEWWKRKLQNGKADAMLKGEKFVRLERRAAIEGAAVLPLEERWWPAMGSPKAKPRLLETIYWPAGETIPARYAAWEQAGTWEVRDTKGDKLIVWRDFTAQERQQLGEIDEARYAIAKTLHNMIHDVETGHYLEWLAQNYAKKEGEEIDGAVVEAREWGGLTPGVLKPGEWVLVPDTKIPGTKVLKYGALAGRYLPGPIWNDVRQMTGRFQPLGESYAAILRAWKMSKTSLSPGVHMNNVMSNFVMADWHDVTAGHVLKALKLMASKDAAAAEVLARFGESGGTIGTWAVKELQQEQLRPLLEALEAELGMAGEVAGQVGVMSALQLAMRGKLGQAFDAARLSKSGQMTGEAAQAMLDTYEAEDQVFRLAAWLKAKEEGASDIAAGKVARKSFLDYRINAPWVQMMRSTALPFVAFTYRAVPMMLETAAKKPWKLAKLGLVAGAINALGYMLSGVDEDDERKLLPEEKSGRIWGITPKLIRMPWNDEHGSPVFLDVRRWVPVGDVFDIGQTHAAVPILPSMQPGGPLMIMAELALNKQGFTGKSITLDTDTATEQATKLADYLWKAAAPNIPVLPGTYSWTAISNSATGKTDTFGREQSLQQAVVSSMGIKVGSYPKDVLRMNAQRAAQAELMEIDRNITMLKREHQKHGMSDEEFREKAGMQAEKKRKVAEELRRRFSGR